MSSWSFFSSSPYFSLAPLLISSRVVELVKRVPSALSTSSMVSLYFFSSSDILSLISRRFLAFSTILSLAASISADALAISICLRIASVVMLIVPVALSYWIFKPSIRELRVSAADASSFFWLAVLFSTAFSSSIFLTSRSLSSAVAWISFLRSL